MDFHRRFGDTRRGLVELVQGLTKDELDTHLQEAIGRIILPWIRALIIGAFLLGGWVATLQIAVNTTQRDLVTLKVDRETTLREWREWRDRADRQLAEVANDVKWIKERLSERTP